MVALEYLALAAAAVAGSTDDLPLWQTFVKYNPQCYLPLDLMFLQDTSLAEEEDKIPTMSRIMQDVASIIDWLHPDSRFAVAEFRDKPIEPYGWSNDVCFNLTQQFTSDRNQMEASYDSLWAGGGYDHSEDHFGAIMNVFGWEGVQWRKVSMETGNTGARVAVLLTDAMSHFAGSHDNPSYPDGVVPNDGVITQHDINQDCGYKQYPSAEQMAAIVKSGVHQYLVMAVPEDTETHIKDFWRYVNDIVLAQPSGLLQIYGPSDKDLETAVLQGLQVVTKQACSDWKGYQSELMRGRLTILRHGRTTGWNPPGAVYATPKLTECSNACSCECSCSVECKGLDWRCCTGDDGVVVLQHTNPKSGDLDSFSLLFGNRTQRHLW